MRNRLASLTRRRPHVSTPIALLALFVALGGTATAASLITGAQVKDSSLTGKDIRNGSIKSSDLARTLRGPRGTGAQGPAGAPGAPGRDGARGADGTNGTDGARGPAGPTNSGYTENEPSTPLSSLFEPWVEGAVTASFDGSRQLIATGTAVVFTPLLADDNDRAECRLDVIRAGNPETISIDGIATPTTGGYQTITLTGAITPAAGSPPPTNLRMVCRQVQVDPADPDLSVREAAVSYVVAGT